MRRQGAADHLELMLESSPGDVAAAIRGALKRVRLSEIPHPLRDAGVIGIGGRVSPRGFRLWYVRQWVAGESDPLMLIGTVRAHGEARVRVRVTSTGQHANGRSVIVFLVLAAVVALQDATGALAVLGLAALMGLAALATSGSRGTSAEERFLFDWISSHLHAAAPPSVPPARGEAAPDATNPTGMHSGSLPRLAIVLSALIAAACANPESDDAFAVIGALHSGRESERVPLDTASVIGEAGWRELRRGVKAGLPRSARQHRQAGAQLGER